MESLHERYDRDERALLDSAAERLWADALLDGLVDTAAAILDAAQWREVPADAGPLWVERATAGNALAAMSLRLARTIALTVRCGYAVESLSGTRRLTEAAGHAQRVAEDQGGQYARNWLHGEGRAGSARAAFGSDPSAASSWKLMSGQSHAVFTAFAAFSASLDEDNVLIHHIGPKRDPFWDNVWIWLTARQLGRVLACILKIHPHVEQGPYLEAMGRIIAVEPSIEAELAKRSQE